MKKSPPDRPLLIIDVGHSQADKGARSPFPPFTPEWDYNLAVAGFIREKLVATASHVILRETTSDGYRNLSGRINALRPDLVISLHCNAAENPSAFGTEMICRSGCRLSQALAESLQREVCLLLGRFPGGPGDRGVKAPVNGRGQSLLKNTIAPCVICEPFFLTNEADYRQGMQFHEALGAAYARAVDAFVPVLAATGRK